MKLLGKILIGCCLIALFAACERDPKKPGFEVLPDMARSVAFDSFAPNPNTPQGKTLLVPVAGTIPRGFMPFPYPATPEGAEQADAELSNPIPYSPDVLARGKIVYENFCLICHGETGKGDGPLIPKYPNPPSFTSKNVRKYSPGRLYHIIVFGSGEMGAYGSQIKPDDRWKLVYYLQKMQGKKPGEKAPETQAMEPETQATGTEIEIQEEIEIKEETPKKDAGHES